MKFTSARPSFRASAKGYDRDDVDSCVRSLVEERERLLTRVAELEAALDASVQYLQARRVKSTRRDDGGTERGRSSRRFRRARLITIALLIGIAIVSVARYLNERRLTFSWSRQAASSNGAVTHAAARAAPIVSPEQPAASTISTPNPSPIAQQTKPIEPAERAPADGLTIDLNARTVCWIGATLDRGRRIERLLQPGETVMLHALNEVGLRVGNAGAVSLTINGEAALPLGQEGQPVTTRITFADYKRLIPRPSP
jgi:hypothetical protein